MSTNSHFLCVHPAADGCIVTVSKHALDSAGDVKHLQSDAVGHSLSQPDRSQIILMHNEELLSMAQYLK